MNIKTFFQQIQNIFKPPQDELQEEAIVKFLRILEDIRAEDMSCDEMFHHMDEFVENKIQPHEAEKLIPLVREHLDMCAECDEEYEALLDVLEHTK
jgi:flagellar motor component MotA